MANPRTAHLPKLIGAMSPKQRATTTKFTPSHPIKAFNWFPKWKKGNVRSKVYKLVE